MYISCLVTVVQALFSLGYYLVRNSAPRDLLLFCSVTVL